MSELSTIREFLNKYNTLDYFLRELVNGDENKGYVSIYKDTLPDLMEQMQFKSLNQLRNQIAHGVYLSDNPIMIDAALVAFIDKHLKRLIDEKEQIKKDMLVAIEKRKEKDLAKEKSGSVSPEEVKTVDPLPTIEVDLDISKSSNTKKEKLKVNENYTNSVADKRKHIINTIFEKHSIEATCFGYKILKTTTNFKIAYLGNTSIERVKKSLPEIKEEMGDIYINFIEDVSGCKYSIIEVSNEDVKKRSLKEFYKAASKLDKNRILMPLGWNSSGKFISANVNAVFSKLQSDEEDVLNYLNSILSSLLVNFSKDSLNVLCLGFNELRETYQNVPNIKFIAENSEDTLSQLVSVMDQRYQIMLEKGCLDIQSYNEANPTNKMSNIMVVVDIDNLNKKEMTYIAIIAAKSRACGMFLFVIVNDKASIPSNILSNLVNRVSLEKDGLLKINNELSQSSYFSNKEFNLAISMLELRNVVAITTEEDPVYEEVKTWVLSQEYCSMSKIQRNFSVGFNRAGKIFKRLQEEGIVKAAPDSPTSVKGYKVLK